VISTDRHFTQAALEVESLNWDASTDTLRGISLGPIGTAYSLSIYIPENYVCRQGHPHFFYSIDSYTLKLVEYEPNVLRVHVRFEKSRRAPWQAKFRLK